MSPATNQTIYPPTAREALRQWDQGDTVFSLELGGIGPSYEQCIQWLVFDAIRAMHGRRRPTHTRGQYSDDVYYATVRRLDSRLRLSGSQVAVARHFVRDVMHHGWGATLSAAPLDRVIQVKRHWPQSTRNTQ